MKNSPHLWLKRPTPAFPRMKLATTLVEMASKCHGKIKKVCWTHLKFY
jgi:hypothetical protein